MVPSSMYLGYDNITNSIPNNNYSLTDSELDTINTSSSSNLYLGDILTETQDISSIYINGVSFESSVTSNLYIASLNNNSLN